MSRGSRILKGDDADHVKYRRADLRERVGKGARVHLLGVADGFGDLAGTLGIVACDLCPMARTDYDTDALVTWWTKHYATHGVDDA